ncbi:MAG: hypothetical protein WCB49_04955 [Gammaproteobacteria bacterium]
MLLGIDECDMERLEQLVETVGPLYRGDHLFLQNNNFSTIYAMRGGCIKSYADNEAGEGQILSFYFFRDSLTGTRR